MYHPYFRGKQNELITIRDKAPLLAEAKFVPIIEPVKESISGLTRAINAIQEAEGEAIVVINPIYGGFVENTTDLESFLNEKLDDRDRIAIGILLSGGSSTEDALLLAAKFKRKAIAFIHDGFAEAKQLATELKTQGLETTKQIFLEKSCGKLYRRNFSDFPSVLLRDGFEKRTNREHPDIEPFSDLHITYEDEDVQGFGDFLIVGNSFSESGGPAYTVAIHITFIDPENDNEMYVHHFKSDDQDTPADPAGKFLQALRKLAAELEKPETKIFRSEAMSLLMDLHTRKHFPGLGVVKKLSMQHHLATLDNFLN